LALVELAVLRARAAGRLLGVQVADPVAQLGGISVLKGLVLAGTDVAPIADEAHEFVVTEQHVHAPARSCRVAFELAEQVDHLP